MCCRPERDASIRVQNICGHVERYRGKRSVLVAYSLGTGSAVVARMAGLARLAARCECGAAARHAVGVAGPALACTRWIVLHSLRYPRQWRRDWSISAVFIQTGLGIRRVKFPRQLAG
ncbi:hypothetical protein Bamb_3842 [Burkholderia ambifaria AMMD]|uniref:Uncharacterized protein n=1 Tax=Burkholderia ambifaria (strain ATCC BAA-244 / DSM 16087 / CCUG 44356 / LMG 19182 / AMMD) TaxID=339670 RepID=Q0B8X7_BURCM|nr:hypothetical protein Bamb_3842 [Burkholderia ambifaria AMMD]